MSIIKTISFDEGVYNELEKRREKRKFRSTSRIVNVILEEHFEKEETVKKIEKQENDFTFFHPI